MQYFRKVFLGAFITGVIISVFYFYQRYEIVYTRISAEIVHQNEIVAEATQTSLKGIEGILRLIGQELISLGALDEPNRGRWYIENAAADVFPMVSYGLAAPDGQLVLIRGVLEAAALPNLMESTATRESFERTLNSDFLQLGRPYFMETLGEWVIPVRVAIKEPSGAVVAVMTAGMRITGEGTVWRRLIAKEDYATAIIHETGYIQYLTVDIDDPSKIRKVYESSLSPYAKGLLEGLKGPPGIKFFKIPVEFQTNIGPRDENKLIAYEYIGKYGLFVFTIKSGTALFWAFVNDSYPVLIGILVIFLLGVAAYRYILVRQRAHVAEITYLARHDAVTGLPNKTKLMDLMPPFLAMAKREKKSCALVFLDLMNFARLNQTNGMSFGDRCLESVAERLDGGVREEDTLARLGGDSFAFFISEVSGEMAADEVAKRIQELLSSPIFVDSKEISMQANLGYALFPEDAETAEELLKAASLACGVAKKSEDRFVMRYNAWLDDRASRRVQIEEELRQTLQNGAIEVYYQPKVDAETGQCTHLEALCRWHSDTFGPVSPAEFIPVAEECGLIVPMGDAILERALIDMQNLEERFGVQMSVAVNFSAKQFAWQDIGETVGGALEKHGFPGHRLTVELTESLMVMDKGIVVSHLQQLRSLGADISIDDFGTGYSSLSYIHDLPVTELKIDRTFVMNLSESAEDRTLIRSIIAMGKALGLRVVAEGVETEDHVDMLRAYGCNLLQGYYFSRPLPPDEIGGWLAERQELVSPQLPKNA
ncbi:MAG: EAL domain-containing protein [Sedimenticola sp.]